MTNSKPISFILAFAMSFIALSGCSAPLKLIPFNQEGYSEDDPFGVSAIRRLETQVAETPSLVTNIVDGKLSDYVSKQDIADGIVIDELDIDTLSLTIGGKKPSIEGHTHSAKDIVDWEEVEFQFPSIEVKSIKVDGKDVSTVGHGHSISDVSGLPNFIRNQSISNAAITAIHSINNSTNILEMQEALTKFLLEFAKQ